jgi:S-DNA-T family DNA segregation ATPase FtsK/SpoIIIE
MDQPAPVRSPAHTGSDGPTDLERLVDVVSTAAREGGFATPRRPWPDPLPTFLALVDLDRGDPPGPWSVPIGMLDEPELQRRRTMWWDAAGGSLAMYGVTGAGTTTALATIAVALAERTSPEDLHLYVFDFDDGTLAPLSELPHVGAVVAAGERERQVRLLRRLSSELDLRRSRAASRGPGVTGSSPRIVVMVDNFAGFTAAYDAGADTPLRDAMHRIVSEGAGVGIVTVVTGSRQSAIPLTLAGAIPGKLVFRMADPLAAASLGLRSIPADCPDGRAIHAATGRTMQIAVPHAAGVAAAVAPLVAPTPAGGPGPVNELPSVVKTDEVAASLDVGGDDWLLPVGIGDADLTVVGLQLAPGDHALVVGEPRSGRSSLLCSLAEMVGGSSCGVTVTAFAPRPSPLRSAAPVDALVTDIAHLDDVAGEIGRSGQRHLLLLDDVDAWDAPPSMVALVASSPPEVHVVAAGRRDLKSQFNHWAKELCRSRIGLWLKPSPGLDGDLWSTPMPRRVPPGVAAGRGYLVCGGTVELVQAAIP